MLGGAAIGLMLGCGGEPTGPDLLPVAGKVTLDGKPATEGAVTLRSVNSADDQPAGLISADGTYKIYLGQQEGAPAGEYRAMVFVRQTPRDASGQITGLPKVIVNQKFTNEHSTPLRLEVKPNAAPGDYDLQVTR